MNTRLKYFFLNSIAFLVSVYINFLSVSLPLNGNTPQDLSAKYENLFVPAGFTFSIWGIIYSFLIIFLIGQLIAAVRGSDLYDKVGFFFVSTCIFNASWLVSWHYEYLGLSVAIMLCLLGTLINYYLNNDFGNTRYSLIEKLQIHAPFSLYLGWISVATIANITAFLVYNNLSSVPIGEVNSTILMITIAAILGILMQFRCGDVLYGFVIIWAFYGIYFKRMIDNPPLDSIIYTLQGGMLLVALAIVFNVIKKRSLLA